MTFDEWFKTFCGGMLTEDKTDKGLLVRTAAAAAWGASRDEHKPKWRPMIEAPRDGTTVFVAMRGGMIQAAFWLDGDGDWVWQTLEMGAFEDHDGIAWMPIPEPPDDN